MDSKLTYRDTLTLVFVSIITDVFILFSLRSIVNWEWLMSCDTKNTCIIGIISIPLLYLEGHLIYALDNLFFIELLSQKFRFKLYNCKCTRWLFYIIYSSRIFGQKCIIASNGNKEVTKEIIDNLFTKIIDNISDRYYVIADFCKGAMFACMCAGIISCIYEDWMAVCGFAMCYFLLYFRAKRYSILYVKYRMETK